METQERDFVLRHLEENRTRLLRAVEGLTPEQQDFRAAADRWSVAECLSHIVLVENRVLTGIERALSRPPEPEKAEEARGKLEQLMQAVPARSARVQAPEAMVPRRDWAGIEELLARFEAARARTLQFAAQTGADLHSHFFPHMIFKELDCYQWLVMIGLHCERHVRQMEETMRDPAFPARVR